MKVQPSLIIYLFLISSLIGCTYDNLEELLEDQNCSTETISFKNDIIPILDLHCTNNICHGGSFPQARVSLTTHEGVLKVVNDGRLLGSVKRLPGFNPMPVDANMLSPCEIHIIQTWIETGALDN